MCVLRTCIVLHDFAQRLTAWRQDFKYVLGLWFKWYELTWGWVWEFRGRKGDKPGLGVELGFVLGP